MPNDNETRNSDDLLTSSVAKPDAGDVTPPHGDEIPEARNAEPQPEADADPDDEPVYTRSSL